MKILLALAVFFLISTQLLAQESRDKDDEGLNYWIDYTNSDLIKNELDEPVQDLLQRIARRPKPQQFFGLMGKRDSGHVQFFNKKRRILDSFYGLMGKRALNSVDYERDAMQNYERRRK